eukprot:795239-Pleurochrysis_carterae.AAC.2
MTWSIRPRRLGLLLFCRPPVSSEYFSTCRCTFCHAGSADPLPYDLPFHSFLSLSPCKACVLQHDRGVDLNALLWIASREYVWRRPRDLADREWSCASRPSQAERFAERARAAAEAEEERRQARSGE